MGDEEQNALIDVSNINEKVYNFIRTNIIKSTYPPGFAINLSQLSQMLGVSQTPIKDALFRLSGEGLIEIAPRKGTYVKDISVKDMHEILQIRLILETAAVETIASTLTDEQVAQFNKIHENMISINVQENEADNYKKYMDHDSEFHALFFRILGNQRLESIYRNLNAHIHMMRFRLLNRRDKIATTSREHENILKALQERNNQKAREAIQNHLISLDSSINNL